MAVPGTERSAVSGVSRRTLLRAGAALVGSSALGGCATTTEPAAPTTTAVGPSHPRVAAAEAARRGAGARVLEAAFTAAPTTGSLWW